MYAIGRWPWVWGLFLAFAAPPVAASEWATPDFREWAALDSTDLQMTSYAADPEASAVFLFDRGHVFIIESAKQGQEYSLVTSRYRRIKILNQASEDLGNVRLLCRLDQVIRNIEARTILPDGRNVPVRPDEIHTAVSGRRRTVTFALPAVSPGCILEYRYEIHADLSRQRAAFLSIDPWVFPNNAPTLVSTLQLTLPPDFTYAFRFLNAAGMDTQPRREGILAPDSPSGRAVQHTWEFHDLPAFQSEPHMGPLADCLLTAYVRLVALHDTYVPDTWNDLANHALEHFDAYLRTGGATQKWLRKWLPEGLSEEQRATRLFEFARDSLQATDPLPQWRLREPWVVLQERSATSIERNLFLTHLLRQASIDARAVMIAGRDQPHFDADWPTLSQFDRVLAQMERDRHMIVLDANCRECGFGTVPAEDRVAVGLVPGWEAEFLSLSGGHDPSSEQFETQITISPPSDVQLHSIWTLAGLAAVDARREILELGAETYVRRRVEARCPDAILQVWTVEDDPSFAPPLRVTVDARVPDALIAGLSDQRTLRLPLLGPNVGEGFEAAERHYPVELDYPLTVFEELTVILPHGASVDYLAPNDYVTARDVTFTHQGQVRSDSVYVARRLALVSSSYSREEYAGLRDVLLRADPRRAEPLILRLPTVLK
jgi:hypothetical protein